MYESPRKSPGKIAASPLLAGMLFWKGETGVPFPGEGGDPAVMPLLNEGRARG